MAHEMTIAHGLAKAILKGAERERAVKVTGIEIEFGQLTFLNIQQVEFWLVELLKESIAVDANINTREIPAKVHCSKCSYEGPLAVKDDPILHMNLPVFACPKCGKGALEILEGRDCIVKSIEILQSEDD